jgi:phospholipase C
MDANSLLENIDTIVIVMLENRSFDHLLGYLSHEQFGNRNEIEGLHVKSASFDCGNPDDTGKLFYPQDFADGWLPDDLPHSRALVTQQIRGGNMDGFVTAYLKANPNDREQVPPPMRFCRPSDIVVTAALAENYCVCDHWFSALPVDTQSNRNMAASGYTRIDTTDHIAPITSWIPNQTTILDWLAQKGLPFELYVDAPFIVGFGRPTNFALMESQWKHLDAAHVFSLDDLQSRWGAPGKGPAVVYCEPYYNDLAKQLNSHGNCNHPPLPLSYGEAFLKRVYDALTSNPKRWQRTVMIVCYDEHGGFFDHVEPPKIPYDKPVDEQWDDKTPFPSLGLRVPAIVVSPFTERRSVCKAQLDHTSILQLVVERFGAPTDLNFFGVSSARKTAGIKSVLAALTRDTARADVTPMPTPELQITQPSAPTSSNGRVFAAAIRAKANAAAAAAAPAKATT